MKKDSYLIPLIVLLIFASTAVAQDMEQNWQGGGGRGGRRFMNQDDMQGGQMQRMRGMGGMDSMGGMGGGMGGMRPMGGGMGGMGQMGGVMGGMSPEAMQMARAQRMQAMLQTIDANHNGQIDPEEAQGPYGGMIDRILRQSGIEPKYPMPLSKVQEAMNNRFRGINGPASPSPASEKSAEETKSAESTSTPLVPGFGVTTVKLAVVPGFGVPISGAADAKKSGTSSDSSSASATATTSTPPLDDRIRQQAKGLLKMFDKNGNGQLEKEEWSQMKADKWAADKNHDGIITLDELTEFMIADSGSGPKQSSGGAIASSAGSSSSASGGKSGKLKFHPPTVAERLAELKLPEWFIRDANSDGQVTMAEYLHGDSSESKAQEFSQYDLNNDGVITPQECLKALKKKK
jgi:Ca2+-binding EF-hand superfamily protein